MPFELPALPYAPNALEPHMSARTFEFHYGKHHKAYVDTLNTLIVGTPFEKSTDLVEIIKATHGDDKNAKIYNNAAQVWNHTFFWNSMKPKGGGEPAGDLAKLITSSFGDLATFKTKFKEAAMTQFGSGWAWLVSKDGKLEIVKTANAVTPVATGQKAILTCDVWEHAYYLDYQNRRADMVQTFLDHLVNWDFAAKNL
jgi:Fe-Mn family superoxide dismutase